MQHFKSFQRQQKEPAPHSEAAPHAEILFLGFRREAAIVFIVFTFLIGNRAGCFAGRLAGRLAFAASAVFDAGGKPCSGNGLDMAHNQTSEYDLQKTSFSKFSVV